MDKDLVLVNHSINKMNLFMLSTGRKFNHDYSPEEQELMDKDLVLVYQERQDLIGKLNQQRKYSSIRAFRRNRYRNAVILRLKLVKKFWLRGLIQRDTGQISMIDKIDEVKQKT